MRSTRNAALIAEHLEAAGDLHGAFDWHMRAGAWLRHRDLTAARASWQRARYVADRLPEADSDRFALRVAPRTMLCVTAWLVGSSMADTGFDELRELAAASGDKISLAMGHDGMGVGTDYPRPVRRGISAVFRVGQPLESIGDPTLTLGLLYGQPPRNT